MQQAVIAQFFAQGCGEGKDIGDLDLLADIAVGAGVIPQRQCALDFLRGAENAAEVEHLIAQARASGIRGSPVVIVDGKFRLDGVQTTDTYVQVCDFVWGAFGRRAYRVRVLGVQAVGQVPLRVGAGCVARVQRVVVRRNHLAAHAFYRCCCITFATVFTALLGSLFSTDSYIFIYLLSRYRSTLICMVSRSMFHAP